MRHLSLALLLTLPLIAAQASADHHGHKPAHDHRHGHSHAHEQAHDHHGHQQENPGAHEHGTGLLDMALEGETLVIMLKSPAANLLGFEHRPATDAEHAAIAEARRQLEQPQPLFGLPPAADCSVQSADLHSPLFAASEAAQAHADIEASYTFSCGAPASLDRLDLSGFFKAFPNTEQLQIQATAPAGQQAATLKPAQPALMLRP